MKLPGPESFAFPVSTMVVPVPMDTAWARVIAACCSNCRVPPPLMPAPAPNSPGPPITSSTLPRPADTDPWSLKSMKPTVAFPDLAAGRLIVPVLRN